MLPSSWSSPVSFFSSARKPCSPRSPKIWLTGIPSRRSISASKSRNVRWSRSPRSLPTVDFPAPGRPTSTMCGLLGSAAETICELRKESVIVAPNLRQGVATEFLEHGLREHEREHAFRNHSHRRDCRDVASFSRCLRRSACCDIHGRERCHERADGLHRYTNHDRLTSGHPTFESPGTIRTPANAASERGPRCRLDLVVHLGTSRARGSEA